MVPSAERGDLVGRTIGGGIIVRKPEADETGIGFEHALWAAADKLRGAVDAAAYKHVVLGLLFLKYVSDRFGSRREVLKVA
jgi:hypothetical protein